MRHDHCPSLEADIPGHTLDGAGKNENILVFFSDFVVVFPPGNNSRSGPLDRLSLVFNTRVPPRFSSLCTSCLHTNIGHSYDELPFSLSDDWDPGIPGALAQTMRIISSITLCLDQRAPSRTRELIEAKVRQKDVSLRCFATQGATRDAADTTQNGW
ncbi:hypothetical protein ASPBRDRAFT_197622 [Aspergillus brasiliensis CBS 101740]|uniref:Uncharacterized protein n=1 Tax=Aspergillus brasiliensis (strain CBS 101740 / IMI 381727 / IBT 21946) TaxID=767769 RepID=A0A1L9UE27_ASPBC|nr:hypothetical protein ASPBRDRAFT_197622 [Aspergillus brasiliensis CBS 101740]